MRWRPAGCAVAASCLALLFHGTAFAENVCDKANGEIHALKMLDCLGASNDKDPSVVTLRKAIDDLPGLDMAVRRTSASDVLDVASKSLVPKTACKAELAKKLAQVNDALLTAPEVLVPDSSDCVNGTSFATECWVPDANSLLAPAITNCPAADKDTVRVEVLVQDLLNGVFAELLAAQHAEATQLRGRWWSYFHAARSQYPWEILVNSACFSRTIKKTKGQFHEPPMYQVILLHPGVALEYFDDAPDGKQFEPTLSVELFGFNRWWWKGEKPARGIGVSVVANYSDIAGFKDWRFGAVIHVAQRYSFGATRASGTTGIFVSADLAALIGSKRKEVKIFMDELHSGK